MTNRFSQLLWLVVALLCGSVLAEEPIRWAPDLPTARRAAAEYKVPLLIHVYGDNCLPCKTLEHRVLSKEEVVHSLNRFFICVKVNATSDPTSRKIAEELNVHSWPTDVFVSPDGKTLFQGVCPQDPRAYSAILENVKVMNRDRNIMLAATLPQQPTSSIAQQLNNVGTQSYTPGLPVPGTSQVSQSTTPTFYTADARSQTAQLPPSTGPNPAMVQHGPILPSAQQSSIAGSTPAANQQLPAAAPQGSNQGTSNFASQPSNGQLPQRQMPAAQLADPNATLQASLPSVNRSTMPVNQASGLAPVNPSTNRLASPSVANTPPAAPTLANPQQVLHNPYFGSSSASAPSTTIAGSLPATAAITTQVSTNKATIPAQPVSFQPRATPVSSQTTQLTPEPTAETPTSAIKPVDDQPAIAGYCPVALRSGTWVAGDPRYAVRHRGRVYWLSNQEAMSEFFKTPDACSPTLSGYDPMLFLKEGKMVEGNVQFGLLDKDNRAFMFFSSAEMKQQFEQDFANNLRAINFIIQQAYGSR